LAKEVHFDGATSSHFMTICGLFIFLFSLCLA